MGSVRPHRRLPHRMTKGQSIDVRKLRRAGTDAPDNTCTKYIAIHRDKCRTRHSWHQRFGAPEVHYPSQVVLRTDLFHIDNLQSIVLIGLATPP